MDDPSGAMDEYLRSFALQPENETTQTRSCAWRASPRAGRTRSRSRASCSRWPRITREAGGRAQRRLPGRARGQGSDPRLPRLPERVPPGARRRRDQRPPVAAGGAHRALRAARPRSRRRSPTRLDALDAPEIADETGEFAPPPVGDDGDAAVEDDADDADTGVRRVVGRAPRARPRPVKRSTTSRRARRRLRRRAYRGRGSRPTSWRTRRRRRSRRSATRRSSTRSRRRADEAAGAAVAAAALPHRRAPRARPGSPSRRRGKSWRRPTSRCPPTIRRPATDTC